MHSVKKSWKTQMSTGFKKKKTQRRWVILLTQTNLCKHAVHGLPGFSVDGTASYKHNLFLRARPAADSSASSLSLAPHVLGGISDPRQAAASPTPLPPITVSGGKWFTDRI